MKHLSTSIRRGVMAVLLTGCSFAQPAQYAFASDETQILAGQELARETCSRCHNVEPGGPFKQFPPSFASISAYRSAGQIRARIIVPPLHSNMPNVAFILTPENVSNLVEYIVSLEDQ
ncbi:MAG: cytochrome c [Rhizobiaceae bacterium]